LDQTSIQAPGKIRIQIYICSNCRLTHSISVTCYQCKQKWRI